MITSPADETTKSAFEKLIKAQEAAAGAPEGGFLEVIELYKDLEKSLPNVDEAVKRLADDGELGSESAHPVVKVVRVLIAFLSHRHLHRSLWRSLDRTW